MITQENILSHEIIGLYATVERCSDIYLTNLSGKIIMETKNIISIETSKGIKHVSKTAAKKIRFDLKSGRSCSISGSLLIGRPEDRISRHH
jgi:ribonuclease P protein subunit POP4